MNFRISNKEFYRRHNLELSKYLISPNSLHIINQKSENKVIGNKSQQFFLNTTIDTKEQLESLNGNKYEQIILTDIIEVQDDIYKLLNYFSELLLDNGKLIISSINTKWSIFLKIFEFLKIKDNNEQFSYIHNKKLKNISNASGFEFLFSYTRQFFPFKLFFIGNLINNFFELVFFFLNLGIKSYIVLRKEGKTNKKLSKSIIVPAKNEEGNLEELINRIPRFTNTEIIFSIGKSFDRTLELANEISQKVDHFDFVIIEQSKNGKANAVWEALDIVKGDLIAILDADISVDPETLEDFFEIIESKAADFVNGTRLIYQMEPGAMRLINKFGNRGFQYLIGFIINQNLTDSLCGTKVFKSSLIKKIKWWQSEFKLKDPFGDFDLLFTASYTGEKILEYPVHYRARTYGKTQISRFRDGFKLIKYLIKSFLAFNSSRVNS